MAGKCGSSVCTSTDQNLSHGETSHANVEKFRERAKEKLECTSNSHIFIADGERTSIHRPLPQLCIIVAPPIITSLTPSPCRADALRLWEVGVLNIIKRQRSSLRPGRSNRNTNGDVLESSVINRKLSVGEWRLIERLWGESVCGSRDLLASNLEPSDGNNATLGETVGSAVINGKGVVEAVQVEGGDAWAADELDVAVEGGAAELEEVELGGTLGELWLGVWNHALCAVGEAVLGDDGTAVLQAVVKTDWAVGAEVVVLYRN